MRALAATELFGSAPESRFDEIAELAAAICEVPICLITLVGEKEQWFKALVGTELTGTSRDVSFCNYTIEQNELLVVPDALEDPRFVNNALVTGDPGVRFYAGYPLSTKEGDRLGALCAIDMVPRQLTPLQEKTLRVLANQVMTQIEMGAQLWQMELAQAENERISAQLQLGEARMRAFLDNNPAGAFLLDEQGRMVYCNRALTAPHGKVPEDWVGKLVEEIWPEHYAEQCRAEDQQVFSKGTMMRFQVNFRAAAGKPLTVDCYKFPFMDTSRRRLMAALTVDVTREMLAKHQLTQSRQSLRELNLKLHRLSVTDGLTKVKNRRGLEECLEREWERAERLGTPLSMVMLDIDFFKQYNDTYGHVAGDEVLQRVASIIKEHTRKTDSVARFGGEEFIALLPNTAVEEATHIARRLCQAVAGDSWLYRQVTVSVGVGEMDHRAMKQCMHFVDAVDQALYTAKQTGKNRVCCVERAGSRDGHEKNEKGDPAGSPFSPASLLSAISPS